LKDVAEALVEQYVGERERSLLIEETRNEDYAHRSRRWWLFGIVNIQVPAAG